MTEEEYAFYVEMVGKTQADLLKEQAEAEKLRKAGDLSLKEPDFTLYGDDQFRTPTFDFPNLDMEPSSTEPSSDIKPVAKAPKNIEFTPGASLEDKMALADEARTLLGTLSPKGYDAELPGLMEKGEELGIDESRFKRFLDRENLKRPEINPEAIKYSERSLQADKEGFSGLADLYRLQSDARAGAPSKSKKSRPLAGSGRAIKSTIDANTPASRLLREAKSLRRRGLSSAANILEGVGARKLLGDVDKDIMESEIERQQRRSDMADALRQDERLLNLKQEAIEDLLDKTEGMTPDERNDLIDMTYGFKQEGLMTEKEYQKILEEEGRSAAERAKREREEAEEAKEREEARTARSEANKAATGSAIRSS